MRKWMLIALAGCASPPTVAAHKQTVAEPMPDWDAKFERKNGWTGADAAYSVDLGGGRVLWLFGDTWIDRFGPKPKMPRNTIAIQRGDSIDFVEREFFKAPDGRGWIWPWAGFVANSKLYLFLNQLEEAGRTDAWNFQYVRTWLGVVDNFREPADAWTVEYHKVPHGEWGVAAVVDRDVAYIFGTHDDPPNRAWRLARVPADRVEDFAAWTCGDADLFDGAGAEGSVSKQGGPQAAGGGRFVAVYTELGLSEKILMRTAPRPEGPWSAPEVVFTCPEAKWDSTYLCYAAKGHPELSKPDELVVTYAVNSTDFAKCARDARIYRPRFVRIPLTVN